MPKNLAEWKGEKLVCRLEKDKLGVLQSLF